MEMCRFSGVEDVEYKKVAAALQRMAEKKRMLSPEQVQTLLTSLGFSQINARHMTIAKAYVGTCEWFLNTPGYIDWLDPKKLDRHDGFLWIKGKPGAGKSTLMKSALGHAKKTMNDTVIIFFFFNARGHELERSTIGMYRSLLLQLLERLSNLRLERSNISDTFNGALRLSNPSSSKLFGDLGKLHYSVLLTL